MQTPKFSKGASSRGILGKLGMSNTKMNASKLDRRQSKGKKKKNGNGRKKSSLAGSKHTTQRAPPLNVPDLPLGTDLETLKQYDMFSVMRDQGMDLRTIELTMRKAGLDPVYVLGDSNLTPAGAVKRRSFHYSEEQEDTMSQSQHSNEIQNNSNNVPHMQRTPSFNQTALQGTLRKTESQGNLEQVRQTRLGRGKKAFIQRNRDSQAYSVASGDPTQYQQLNGTTPVPIPIPLRRASHDSNYNMISPGRSSFAQVSVPGPSEFNVSDPSGAEWDRDSASLNSFSNVMRGGAVLNGNVANEVRRAPGKKLFLRRQGSQSSVNVAPVSMAPVPIQGGFGAELQQTLSRRNLNANANINIIPPHMNMIDSRTSVASVNSLPVSAPIPVGRNTMAKKPLISGKSRNTMATNTAVTPDLNSELKQRLKSLDPARFDKISNVEVQNEMNSLMDTASARGSFASAAELRGSMFAPAINSNANLTAVSRSRKNPVRNIKLGSVDETLNSQSSRTLNQQALYASTPRPISERPKTHVNTDVSNAMSLRSKNGIPLKILPFDSPIYMKFKAMQIEKRDPRDVVRAMEAEALDPMVLYPRIDPNRADYEEILSADAEEWQFKFSKRYRTYYYQNQRTGETMWKDDVDKLTGVAQQDPDNPIGADVPQDIQVHELRPMVPLDDIDDEDF